MKLLNRLSLATLAPAAALALLSGACTSTPEPTAQAAVTDAAPKPPDVETVEV